MGKYGRKRLGDVFESKKSLGSYKVKIIEGGNKPSNIIGIFLIDNKTVIETNYSNFKNGEFKYPYHKTVFNKGYLGVGKYKTNEGKKINKRYMTWTNMLKRCYCPKTKLKQPSYKNVIVCDEWLNYQNFSKWYEDNFIEGMELDKDLINKGSKIYSPKTCCFIPKAFNLFLSKEKKTNKSGFLGVNYDRRMKKFYSEISVDSKKKFLGYFEKAELAADKYNEEYNIILKNWIKKLKIKNIDKNYYR